MERNMIDPDCVYISPVVDSGYIYIRGFRGVNLVGFSTLDNITDNPDFSDSGIFWVREEDFLKMFVPYTNPFSNRKIS